MATVFERIIAGELPAEKVFENERILVIQDLYPVAPTHLLVISKKVIPSVGDLKEEDDLLVGEMMRVAAEVAQNRGLEEYRLITNRGPSAGQSIYHLHFHLIGGRQLGRLG
ncbi:MAG: histidine triad nucleotide-binding protein [Parachlamydiales bacterium]